MDWWSGADEAGTSLTVCRREMHTSVRIAAMAGIVFLFLWQVQLLRAFPASGSEISPFAEAGLVDSGDLTSAELLAHGTLSDGSGAAVGGTVALFAWPADEVMEGMVEGDEVDLIPVGYSEIEAGERFELRVGSDVDLEQFVASGDDTVDFTIVGQADTGEAAVYALSRELGTGPGGEHHFALPGVDEPDPEEVAGGESLPAAATSGTEIALDVDLVAEIDAPVPEGGIVPMGTPPSFPCDTYTVRTIRSVGVHDTVVGQSAPTGVARATLTYKQSATTNFSVAAEITPGNWALRGDVSRSKSGSAEATFPPVTILATHITGWEFAEYEVTCRGGDWPQTWDEIRPWRWVGGSENLLNVGSMPVAANYCRNYDNGSIFSRQSSRAATVARGVRLQSLIGLDLRTQSGLTSEVTATYTFTQDGQMCGDTAHATLSALTIHARSRGTK